MCKYCELDKDIRSWNDEDEYNIYIEEDDFVIQSDVNTFERIEINFCPMCGRKLNEEV